MANASLQTALVASDLTVAPSDFPSVVVLVRNFLIIGTHENVSLWPWVDLAYVEDRVQLQPGVVLNFSRIVAGRARSKPHFQAPGLDLLLPSKPARDDGTGGGASVGMVTSWGAAIVLRVCLPATDQNTSVISMPRPVAVFPGQNTQRRIAWPPASGCSNASGAPPMQRCWPAVGWYEDMAMYGHDVDAYGNAVSNGYYLWLYRSYYLCEAMMSDGCVAQYGTVGCFNRLASAIDAAPADAGLPASSPPQPLPASPAGGVSTRAQAPLVPLLGGLMGGVVGVLLLTVLVAVAVAAGRRRQLRLTRVCKEAGELAGERPSDCPAAAHDSGACGRIEGAPLRGSPFGQDRAANACGLTPAGSCKNDNATVHGLRDELEVAVPARAVCPNTDDGSPPPPPPPQPPEEPEWLSTLQQLPVTPLTPFAPGLELNLHLRLEGTSAQGPGGGGGSGGGGGGEVELLPDGMLGKGAMGRVVMGMYRGERVAVKMLNTGLLTLAVAPPAPPLPALLPLTVASPTAWVAAATAAVGVPAGVVGAGESRGAARGAEPAGERPAGGGLETAAPSGSSAGTDGQTASCILELMQAVGLEWGPGSGSGSGSGRGTAGAAAAGRLPGSAGPAVSSAPPAPALEEEATAFVSADGPQPSPPWQHQPPPPLQPQPQQHHQEQQHQHETGPTTLASRALAQEVEVLARCRHPNVIRLLAASLQPPHMCLVMELMETSLYRMLYPGNAAQGRLLPLPTVLHISLQVAQALAYLHPTILHRDLKPANILVSQPGSALPVVKLADFGLSRLRDTTLVTRHPDVGTAPYMAPEAFDVYNFTITPKADVWAFGVVLWEMLSGRQPWRGHQFIQVAMAISMHGRRLSLGEDVLPPERCPPQLRDLIANCWETDPARRPAAAEIVKCLALMRSTGGESGSRAACQWSG